jgi:hypothetical protein
MPHWLTFVVVLCAVSCAPASIPSTAPSASSAAQASGAKSPTQTALVQPNGLSSPTSSPGLGGWSRASLSIPEGQHIDAITAFHDRLFGIVGRGTDENGLVPGLVSSSMDGINWESGTDETFRGFQLASITAGDEGIVVVGSDGEPPVRSWAWYSPDGRSWAGAQLSGPVDTNVIVAGVVSGPRGFVAVGDFSAGEERSGELAWSSADGRHWKRARFAAGHAGTLTSVINTPIGYMAAGFSHLWTTKDGRVWRRGADISELGIERLAAGNGWLIGWSGGSADPRIYVSQDAKAWRPVEIPGLDYVGSVLPTPAGFVALGTLDTYTPDGNITDTHQVIATALGDPTNWVQVPDQRAFHEPDIAISLALLPGGDRVIAVGGRTALIGPAP